MPLAAVQFYVQSAAGILALWPLAHHMRRNRADASTSAAEQTTPAG